MKIRQLSRKEVEQMQERAEVIDSLGVVKTSIRSRYEDRPRLPTALLLVRSRSKEELLPFSVEDPQELIESLRRAVTDLESYFPN